MKSFHVSRRGWWEWKEIWRIMGTNEARRWVASKSVGGERTFGSLSWAGFVGIDERALSFSWKIEG